MPWSDGREIGKTQHGVKDVYSRVNMSSVYVIAHKYLLSFIGFAAVLRISAGDKERCLQDSSNVHPHTT